MKGELKILYIKSSGTYYPIGCLTSNSLSESLSMRDQRTADSSDGFVQSRPGRLSYSISFEGMLETTGSMNYFDMVALKRARTLVEWKIESTEDEYYQTGSGYISSISESSPVGDYSTFGGVITGVGAPTTTPVSQAVDTDYQAILDHATAQGYTLPSATQQIHQNNLVVSLKSAGIWNKLDLLYIFATDGDRDYAKLNWIAPSTFQCAEVNSPTFTSNVGFNGNGTTSYLNPSFIPSTNGTNLTLNSASLGFKSPTNDPTGGNMCEIGTNPSGDGDLTCASTFTTLQNRMNSLGSGTVAETSTNHFYHSNRSSSNAIQFLRDGSSVHTGTVASISLSNTRLMILACGNSANSGSFFSDRVVEMAFVGGSLLSEASAFNSAISTYMSAI